LESLKAQIMKRGGSGKKGEGEYLGTV